MKKLMDAFFRIWYWYISKVDKNAEITFMNYGCNYLASYGSE